MSESVSIEQARKLSRRGSKPAFAKILSEWCDNHGLPRPYEEWRFNPPRRHRFDFAWPNLIPGINPTVAVALEVEGGTFAKVPGRHGRGPGYEDDCRKYNEAALLGWRVLRVTTGMVERGEVWGLLEKAFGVKP